MPDNGGNVLGDQMSRIGIGAVENELNGGILLSFDLFREVPVDFQHPLDGAVVEKFADLFLVLNHPDDPEVFGGHERCDQFPALLAVAQVHDAQPYVRDIHVHGVTEDHELDEWRKEEENPRPLVSEDLNEFLPDDVLNSQSRECH